MNLADALSRLKSLSDPKTVGVMARYGINPANILGISVPNIRGIAKEIGTDHALALELWSTGIHEARILATMTDDPRLVDGDQLESWVADLDSWDVCDQCCGNLFDKTKFAYDKAVSWSKREKEFTKRAGFVLMACLAVHDKKANDDTFLGFLPRITNEAGDERNFVKKAINWALRQIGKRNLVLNRAAILTAKEIQKQNVSSAKWIASDALRELGSEKIQSRLHRCP